MDLNVICWNTGVLYKHRMAIQKLVFTNFAHLKYRLKKLNIKPVFTFNLPHKNIEQNLKQR